MVFIYHSVSFSSIILSLSKNLFDYYFKATMSFIKQLIAVGIFCLFFTFFLLSAQETKENPFPVTAYKLSNGLQVILSEDYSLPVVSVVVSYQVGPINEISGKTGLAYILRNLMFQGSRNIGRMQHVSFIHRVGGRWNAATLRDKTVFFQTVPSNQLALVLWLESDRMQSLAITVSKVENAKKALIEEIRLRKNDDPYLENFSHFDNMIFSGFAYGHPVMGEASDVREITIIDVNNFYATYYKPNNAVLCITGNINKIKTRALIQKYFKTISRGKNISAVSEPVIEDNSEDIAIQETVDNPLASLPGFHLGFRIAKPNTPDFYPLKIIEYILLRGKTSRLQKRLLKRDLMIAYSLNGGIEQRKDFAVFRLFVTCNNEAMVERSKRAVFSELNKLKSSMISKKELDKAKNMFKIDFTDRYSTSADKAIFLAELFFNGTPLNSLNEELDKYLSVSSYKINIIMKRYFTQRSYLLRIKTK